MSASGDSDNMSTSTPVTILQDDSNTDRPRSSSTLPAFAQRSLPDFVLVWNESSKTAVHQDGYKRRSIFESNLDGEGLILQWDQNDDEQRLHVLNIWAPLEVLKRYSEILKVRLPMKQLAEDDEKCQPASGRSSRNSSSLLLKSGSRSSSTIQGFKDCWTNCRQSLCLDLDPVLFPEKCRRLTGVYSRDKEYLFDVDESNFHDIFPISMRSRIVQYILKRKPYKSESELELDNFAFGYERLVQKGVYEAGYPLHDGTIRTQGSTRKLLFDHWGRLATCCKYQPLDTLRDYFGVNITLYFAWLGYYTGMLAIASVFGLACFIYGLASIKDDQYVNDVCNKSAGIVMCPPCDNVCPYWNLSDRCQYSKFAHLFENDFTIAFALLMSVWTAFFLEFWKRYSARITYRWDLTSFDIRDFTPRPEYVAELKKIYPKGKAATTGGRAGGGGGVEDTGETNRKYDFELSIPFWRKKLPFRILSYSFVLLMVVLALSALIGVIMYRLWFTFWLSKGRKASDGDIAFERITVSFTAALLNLTFIVMFGRIYEKIALKLTEMEIPRTQLEFDASYTLKIYLLQFINNYSSIFYVAFFKGAYAGAPHKYHKLFGILRQEECGISCMPELCVQLVVILVGKQTKSMFMEAFVPWCKRGVKRASARLKIATTSPTQSIRASTKASVFNTQWLEDYDLLEWGQYLLTDEYLEMVLQFGFVTIFVTAFPLAPLFALINNLFELRVDASKMLRHYRRPIGIRVKDIGVWSNIVDGIVKVAILSNACIIALTSNFVPKFMYRYILQDPNSPNYGTLNGYLNDSLTAFDTNDLEARPEREVLSSSHVSSPVCHFPTYRYGYTSSKKYEYRVEHWQIWLGRVIFIIVYENVVAAMLLLLRWFIPDIPKNLLRKMQREQKMINDLVMKQELKRAHHSNASAHHIRSFNTLHQFVREDDNHLNLNHNSANRKK